MGSFSIWHWLIVLVIVLVLFGGSGKITRIMADTAQGIKAFKRNVKDEAKEKAEAEAAGKVIDADPVGSQKDKAAS